MTREEWARKRAEIDALMVDYEQAINAANAWYADWKARNSGFRCVRDRKREAAG